MTILSSADGRLLYVAETGRNRNAEVAVDSGRALRRLPAGAQGDGLAIAPEPPLPSAPPWLTG